MIYDVVDVILGIILKKLSVVLGTNEKIYPLKKKHVEIRVIKIIVDDYFDNI